MKELFNETGLDNERNKYLATEKVLEENCLKFMDVICNRVNNIYLLDEYANDEKEKEA